MALKESSLGSASDLVGSLANDLSDIMHEQKRLIQRVHTHHATNESTNRRVVFWALTEALLLVLVAAFQVVWLQRFLEKR